MNPAYQMIANLGFRLTKKAYGTAKTLLQRVKPYDPDTFWDGQFYEEIDGDADTIKRSCDPLTAAYHYASLETAVILALTRAGKTRADSLLDLGSGTGHWIDFFCRIFPGINQVDACDVSAKSCEFLKQKYAGDPGLRVHHGTTAGCEGDRSFDLVCLLGCAFHIVRDSDLADVLDCVASRLRPGGVIVANDLLPIFSHANQFARDGRSYNKYVRSRRRWRKLAQVAGLQVRFLTNHAWLRAPGRIPEGHIVCLAATAAETVGTADAGESTTQAA